MTRKGSAVVGVKAMRTNLFVRVVPDSTSSELVFAMLHVVRPVHPPPLATRAKEAVAEVVTVRIRKTAQAPSRIVVQFVVVDSEVSRLLAKVVVQLVKRPRKSSATVTSLDLNVDVL